MNRHAPANSNGVRLIDLDLQGGVQLSDGNDSNVYRFDAVVAKEYKRLGFEEVRRYVELQNAAAAILPQLDYRAEIAIGGVSHVITARQGVPVDELGGCYIGKYNVKLVPFRGQHRIDLIITDLAVYIDRLRYGAPNAAAGERVRAERRSSPLAFPPDQADLAPLSVDLSRAYIVRYFNPTANKALHVPWPG